MMMIPSLRTRNQRMNQRLRICHSEQHCLEILKASWRVLKCGSSQLTTATADTMFGCVILRKFCQVSNLLIFMIFLETVKVYAKRCNIHHLHSESKYKLIETLENLSFAPVCLQYTPGVLQTIYHVYCIYHIYRVATKLLPDNYDICGVYRKSTANLQLSTASYTVYTVYKDFQTPEFADGVM